VPVLVTALLLVDTSPTPCLLLLQEREAALSELQHRLDRRAAELDELKASTNAALTRRCVHPFAAAAGRWKGVCALPCWVHVLLGEMCTAHLAASIPGCM
jgi:hypothetical protein